MGILLEARRNLNDVRKFGPQILLRHLNRLRGSDLDRVSIPGIGAVYLRPFESDLSTFRQVFAYGEYDLSDASVATERLRDRYRTILNEGHVPIIVDAGANVGAASLWFASRYPRAGIVAIEPEPGNAAILRLNLDGKQGVVILECGVAAESGFATVVNEGDGWGARTIRANSGTPLITVSEACQSIADGELFIVKVDIEGFEKDLFSGNVDWLDQAHMVIIEPHDWMLPGERSSGPFQKAMASRNFELFISGENLIYVRL